MSFITFFLLCRCLVFILVFNRILLRLFCDSVLSIAVFSGGTCVSDCTVQTFDVRISMKITTITGGSGSGGGSIIFLLIVVVDNTKSSTGRIVNSITDNGGGGGGLRLYNRLTWCLVFLYKYGIKYKCVYLYTATTLLNHTIPATTTTYYHDLQWNG